MEFSPSFVKQCLSFCNDRARAHSEDHRGDIRNELRVEDSLLMVFPTALGAIEATSAIHRDLLAQGWYPKKGLCRSAIVTGDIDDTIDDNVSPLIHTLYALKEVARPGQILVSEATHAIVRQVDGHAFLNLGLQHLEDLQWAQMIFQLMHPKLPLDFQPLPSTLTAASKLPRGLTPLVGRGRECQDIRSYFFLSRVVALTGFGGVGKSRLAVRVAYEVLEDHYHGATYVDLAGASSAAQILLGMSSALGVREAENVTLHDAVIDSLRPMETLLIFDNAHGTAEQLPSILKDIVEQCPHVQVLITCRQALDLEGIHHYPVQPLAVPSPELIDPEALEEVDAVALFVERAVSAAPDFVLSETNVHHVAQICRKLEGIPLAIELAASQVAHLSVHGVLQGLQDRFALLRTGEPGEGIALESVIDWSFQVLRPTERLLITRMSVFVGEVTLEATVSICQSDELSEEDIRSAIETLVRQSLLIKNTVEGTTYLKLLETIREFGRSILISSGGIYDMQERHANWFSDFASEKTDQLHMAEQTSIATQIDLMYKNFTAALEWTLSGKKSDERSSRMVIGLYMYWYLRSRFAEGLSWSEEVLQRMGTHGGVTKGRVHTLAAIMAAALGQYQTAERHFKPAMAIAKREKNQNLLYGILGSSGNMYAFSGSASAAKKLLTEALEIARELENDQRIADSLNNLAVSLIELKQYDHIGELLAESIEINTRLKRSMGLAASYFSLGRTARLQKNYEVASEQLESAFIHYFEAEDFVGITATIRELVMVRVDVGSYHSAAALFGAEAALRKRQRTVTQFARQAEYERYSKECKRELGDRFLVEFERGKEMNLQQVKDFILINTPSA